jgi:hypothetical protein
MLLVTAQPHSGHPAMTVTVQLGKLSVPSGTALHPLRLYVKVKLEQSAGMGENSIPRQ